MATDVWVHMRKRQTDRAFGRSRDLSACLFGARLHRMTRASFMPSRERTRRL